jgi:hypothetical protein
MVISQHQDVISICGKRIKARSYDHGNRG